MAHLIPDRTTLIIAHRLSTVEHADQVLVLQSWLKRIGLIDQELPLDQFYSSVYSDGARALIGEVNP